MEIRPFMAKNIDSKEISFQKDENKKLKKQKKLQLKEEKAEQKKQLKAQKLQEKKQAKILKIEQKKQSKAQKKLQSKAPKEIIEKHQKELEKAQSREKRLTFTEGSYALDNAALIYPPARTGVWNAGFRVSAILKEDVQKDKLQKALDQTMERFPYYNVSLRRGIFWYYFQVLPNNPKVIEEENYPCSVFDFRGDRPIFRVLYYKNKISLEFFHSLGDGYGGVLFLNSILINYFKNCGHQIDSKKYFINPEDYFDADETEDSFLKYADLSNHASRKEKKGWQISGTRLEYGQTRVINGIMNTQELKAKCKEFDANINEFLLALLIYSLKEVKLQTKKKKKNNVKVSMPIDCRRFLPSITMRNFSSYKNFELEDESLDFESVIQFVKNGLKEIDKDYLMRNINTNVLPQVNPFVRIMPLYLKNFILRMCFNAYGEKLFTTSFSNLGVIKAPEEFADLVERYDAMIGGGKLNKINVASCSYNNKTVVTFSRTIKETLIEKTFFRHLTDFGIGVDIETN